MIHAWRSAVLLIRSPSSKQQYRRMSASVLRSDDLDRYQHMSREELIKRIAALELAQPSTSTATTPPPTTLKEPRVEVNGKPGKEKTAKTFDIKSKPCRKIALRFSYDGASYNGLATQNYAARKDQSDIVAVEDVLWKALCETRLVGADDTMGGVGWSRCGRTDRGVSAGGQVVALWVRSRKVDQWKARKTLEAFIESKKREQGRSAALASDGEEGEDDEGFVEDEAAGSKMEVSSTEQSEGMIVDAEGEELPYVANLNSVLPPTIRIQAWSPVRPHFSSRFDCRYRHYKYFFTSGSSFLRQATTKGPVRSLDVARMRVAAQKLLGDHDFRNFCRVDASKQIDNYRRRVDGISIDEVSQPWPRSSAAITGEERLQDREAMFVLNLRGTAFLYHQVRHIVAILFLIGAGLEKPGIIDELLNVSAGAVARDRLLMRRRGLVLDEEEDGTGQLQTTLPGSTATTMTGYVASDNFKGDLGDDPMGGADVTQTPAEAALQSCLVYERKPAYEMASDRPLMLWECGFKESDIQWRSGTYDGPLPPQEGTRQGEAICGDVNSTSAMTSALLHSHWSSLAVRTELYKHFLLALPLGDDDAHAGYIPASTFFAQSSSPTLEKALVLVDQAGQQQRQNQQQALAGARRIVPLGDGKIKALQAYKGLRHAKLEETPEVKNANYLHGRGKRRAERKKQEVGAE